ncbi:protein-disulfide reductase DsbD [Oceanobacter mangrovi]|uniref:protein-disulfide reductase DsbD n=1 Tax=Oceanobacter mangrovi TaxID=2862510 RepID=UPI001C8DF27C|nr:protein-disulfide reductase DsbD [Oceanobacter mangrovi]
MRLWIHWLFAWTLLIGFASANAGLFDKEPEFLPVEQAFPLDTTIDGGLLVANWQSAPGYYLYQHRIFLKQNDQQINPVNYSIEGKAKFDEAFGDIIAYYGPLEVLFPLEQLQPGPVVLNYQGCADAGLCYPPQRVTLEISQADIDAAQKNAAAAATRQPTSTTPIEAISPAPAATSDWFSGSLLSTVGLFFLLGLGLTFTPCVLPMIPIMTSVVMGQNRQISTSRGFLLSTTYVLGMAITYAAAGVLMGLLGAGANIQAWMQTPWVLILFAIFFIAMALAMFGLYELQLPAALRNRLNSISQKQSGGHIVSVFVIGVLSALVVSPCVSAPLAGALVYLSTTGDVLMGGAALLALGLGMGTPLIILGTTGGSVLPKAGAWMEQAKVFFGVMLLAVAIWLINRIIPAPASLALWGALALIYGVVLGALNSATPRLLRGIALLLLIYGTAAVWGALQGNGDPLQPLANNWTGDQTSLDNTHAAPFSKTTSVAEIQQIISTSSQPVMLDFYADWCISCKVMDEEIFSNSDVQQQLKNVRWLQLDLTANTEEHVRFLQSHAVFGPPTVLFFEQGKEISQLRIAGEIDRDEFLLLTQPLQ